MSTIPRSIVDDDRPPAGTPCCVCQTAGHWCPGEVWCAGDGGQAICRACQNQVDCEVITARKKKPELFIPDEAPASVRSLPLPKAQVSQDDHHTSSPVPTSAATDDKAYLARYEAIAKRLLELAPGETVNFSVPSGLTLKAFERGLLLFLNEHPQTNGVHWVHGPDRSGTRLVMSTEAKLKGVSRAKVSPAKCEVVTGQSKPVKIEQRPTKKRGPYKQDQRETAKSMLQHGYSVAVVHERTGLSEETVRQIQRGLGLNPQVSTSVKIEQKETSVSQDVTTEQQAPIVLPSVPKPAAELSSRSVYRQAIEATEAELKAVALELQRLQKRQQSLEAVRNALMQLEGDVQ